MRTPKKLDLLGDRFKYLRPLQKTSHSHPLQKRGVKSLPPALTKYVTIPRQLQKIKLQTAARGKGTNSAHNRVFLLLERFLEPEGENLMDLDAERISEYLDKVILTLNIY